MEPLWSEQTAFLMVAALNRIALSEAVPRPFGRGGHPLPGFIINRVRPAFGEGKAAATPWEAGWPQSNDTVYSGAVQQVWTSTGGARAGPKWTGTTLARSWALGPDLSYVEVPELEGESTTSTRSSSCLPI